YCGEKVSPLRASRSGRDDGKSFIEMNGHDADPLLASVGRDKPQHCSGTSRAKCRRRAEQYLRTDREGAARAPTQSVEPHSAAVTAKCCHAVSAERHSDQATFCARCGNIARRAASSMSVLKMCLSFSARARTAAGRALMSARGRRTLGRCLAASGPSTLGISRDQPHTAMSTMV